MINFKTNTKNLIIRYEIVLKGQKNSKSNSQTLFYEYLFSEQGEIEEEIQFEFRNTDNIEY